MDIDFSLVLVNLVFITGVISLLDIIFLNPKRQRALANYEAAGTGTSQSAEDEKLRENLTREPVIVEYAKSLLPVFFVVLIFRSFVAEPFKIPSESMLPTLEIGDYILVNKFHYGYRLPVIGTKIKEMNEPKRGDIMVFKFPNNPKINFIKRVVGLPGDKLSYENKRLYLNGEKLDETLLSGAELSSSTDVRTYQEIIDSNTHRIQKRTLQKSHKVGSWEVPEGRYFVMGDNRDNSHDSRFWGTVPDKYVVGKAYVIWTHKLPGWHLPSFSRNTVLE